MSALLTFRELLAAVRAQLPPEVSEEDLRAFLKTHGAQLRVELGKAIESLPTETAPVVSRKGCKSPHVDLLGCDGDLRFAAC